MLEGYVRELNRRISDADLKEDVETSHLARKLHAILLEPIAHKIRPERVICIVPDKNLSYLPFAALVSDRVNRFFVEDYSFVLSPSATAFVLLSELANTKKSKDEILLGIGNPAISTTEASSFAEIPEATQEVQVIARHYSQAKVLTDGQATEASFRNLAGAADVIHIAAHSVANPRSPLLSKLLLAPSETNAASTESADGALHAYELFQLGRLPARLAILSACETGSGRLYQGEGVLHLARPFLAMGVPVVVASLWKVDSRQSKELMTIFHQLRVRENLSVVQALRLAQLEMIRRNRVKSFSWASFQIIGGYSAKGPK